MKKTNSDDQSFPAQRPRARAAFLRQFGRDEDGSLIITTLMLLVVMLVLGGMAVDFMRFESRRAALQSVADRSVLAAAELDQELDAKGVVIDFFKKTGYANAIVGQPKEEFTAGKRTVSVEAKLDLNTFYLQLIGIDQLAAPASSAAVEGAGDVEISLVLDISGSMGDQVAGTGKTRIALLREAATGFVNRLLVPRYKDKISMSLVTYSAHVNVGDGIFNAINVVDPHPLRQDNPAGAAVPFNPDQLTTFDIPTRCVDIPASHFSTTAFNENTNYKQVEAYQYYGPSGTSGVTDGSLGRPICPNASFEGIVPLTQTPSDLTDVISQLQPRGNTSIHLGMKWGVTLVDPSFRDTLATVSSVDPKFAGNRPADYPAADASPAEQLANVKYVILMTDGQNVQGRRIERENYDTISERMFWASVTSPHAYNNLDRNMLKRMMPDLSDNSFNSLNNFNYATGDPDPFKATMMNTMLQNICTAAKNKKIIIFSIAMGAQPDGEKQMKDCAQDGNYFKTDGTNDGLNKIFNIIASQITDLRLNL